MSINSLRRGENSASGSNPFSAAGTQNGEAAQPWKERFMLLPNETLAGEEIVRETIASIPTLDPAWHERAKLRLNTLTKPLGSLGRLEEIAARLVSIREEEFPAVSKKVIFTLAADHGVTEESISAYPREVTRQMVINFLSGGAAINVLCRQFGIEVVVVDIGVYGDTSGFEGLVQMKIARGTRNMARGPAMMRTETFAALEAGIALAKRAESQGKNLVGIGEMGIGNTTAASAVAAVLCGKQAAEVTGKGAGLDEVALRHKISIIDQALRVNRPNSSDAIDILSKVGGFEIAGMAGLVLGAAARRIPVVIDGFISTAAAAVAVAIDPRVKAFLFPSHRSTEPGHAALLSFIGLEPFLNLEMRLGEGTGAALAMPLIEASAKLLREMATFSAAGVSESQR
jgi:nicotinate-nucleotide--dimethylbenzimidazole phosphoribosyltransferase